MTSPGQDYCRTPGKARYGSALEAHNASGHSPNLRAYRCRCGAWHLATRGNKSRARFRAGIRPYYKPTTKWKAGEV